MNPPSLPLHKRLFRPGAYPQPPASLAEDFAFHLLVDLEEARAEGLTDAAVIAERYGVPVEMVHALVAVR